MSKRYSAAIRKVAANKMFLEGKVQEFMGYLELGHAPGVETSREQVHALTDVYLDSLQDVHTIAQEDASRERRKY